LFETPHGKGAYDRIGRTIKTPIMSRSWVLYQWENGIHIVHLPKWRISNGRQ
jgi:hypothetical protein